MVSVFAFLAHSYLAQLEKRLKNTASTIVLDTELRKFFSLDPSVGLIGSVITTFFSFVGLYSIPFSRKQRIELVQTILPEHICSEKFLFSPGGFLDLHEKLRYFVDDKKVDVDVDHNGRGINDQHCHSYPCVLHDLSFHEGCHTSEADSLTEDDTTRVEVPELNTIPEHDDDFIRVDNSTSTSRITQPMHIQNLTARDPIELIQNMASEYVYFTFKKVNSAHIRRVALVASISLFIQLKCSRTARKMVWNTFHASMSFGLVGLVVGSLGTLNMKSQIKEFFQESYYHQDLNQIQNIPRCQSNYVMKFQPMQRTRKVLSNILESICKDKNFKRRWRAVLAIALVYMFRKRRLKR